MRVCLKDEGWVLADGGGAWLLYACCVRHAALRAFREWLLAALAAAMLAVVLAGVIEHRLTLLVIAASVGAATLGMLSYQVQKAVVRRVRSRHGPGGS